MNTGNGGRRGLLKAFTALVGGALVFTMLSGVANARPHGYGWGGGYRHGGGHHHGRGHRPWYGGGYYGGYYRGYRGWNPGSYYYRGWGPSSYYRRYYGVPGLPYVTPGPVVPVPYY